MYTRSDQPHESTPMSFIHRLAGMNCHYRYFELSEFFRHISELGITNAEIWTGPMHFYVDYAKHDNIDDLAKLAASYGVTIIGLCPEQTNPKPNNVAIKQGERQPDVLAYYKTIIDLTKAIGANQMVITGGWSFYNESRDEAWERSVHMMQRIASHAYDQGVTLALEALQPDESLLVTDIATVEQYRADVGIPSLKVCLDFGAMARAGETPDQYFAAFGQDIVHVHFVDGAPTGHLAWGDGNRDLQADLDSLDANNYTGFLSLETATSRYFEQPWRGETTSLQTFATTTWNH